MIHFWQSISEYSQTPHYQTLARSNQITKFFSFRGQRRWQIILFKKSIRKSQTLNPKFYLIDCGLKKSLEGSLEQKPVPMTSVFGELFKHFVINEIKKLNHQIKLT